MGAPLKESFNPSKDYRLVEWLAGRDAQDFSLNEMQRLLDLERERLAGSVWKEAGIASGLQHTLLGNGQIQIQDGACMLRGRLEQILGSTLTYPTGVTTGSVDGGSATIPIGVNPTSLGFASAGTAYLGAGSGALEAFAYTGVDGTGFTGVTGIGQTWGTGTQVVKNRVEAAQVKWLEDLVTVNEDASLVSPTTGDVVEERIRVKTTLALTTPDALDELFETFVGTLPLNWVLASGGSDKGFPPKFGTQALRLVHTTGTETRIEREVALPPNTAHIAYLWVRTVEGKQNLSAGNGAFFDLQRASPAWNPTDYIFQTGVTYTRHAIPFTSDANVEPATVRIVIPAAAPSTEILVDALLISTLSLAALDRDRHYFSILFWDRATDTVTRAVARPSNLRMQDLEPPLSGVDIIDLELNPGFQDFTAEQTYDEHGHYRVPPGMMVERDASLDTGSVIGLRVTAGKAYVFGYRVRKPVATGLTIGKATTTAAVTAEGHSYAFGTFLYGLNKALGLDNFPVEALTAVTAEVEESLTISRGGSPNTADSLGVTNVVSIQGVSRGTQGSHTGSAAGPFTFDESNNVLRVAASPFAGGAVGAFQPFTFARGTYTLTEVLEALNSGTGRAYRSGKIVGNVLFESDGSNHLRIKTKTQSTTSSFQIDTTGNGSTADTPLGLTANTYTGTGTQYVVTTDWVQSGNSIDWTPGGAEPSGGQSYSVIVRRTKTMAANTDYRLGGVFAATQTYHYKVATWGASGEGIPSAAVNRSTLAGEINLLTWTAVPNALSYHVYRSSDGGSTYNFLKNVTAAAFVDDGSLTPDATKHPATLSTTLNGALSGGEGTVTVLDTTGFATPSGTAFIEGADIFTYTGTSGTTFTGCSGVVAHPNGATVRPGPDIGALTLALDELGVINWSPVGVSPADVSVFNVTYTYYQPRIDLITVDRRGVVRVVRGVPADQPLPPGRPVDQMDLAQIRAEANSTTTTITNSGIIDRPLVTDLKVAMARIETLFANDLNQQILNDIDKRITTAKKGLFADAMASEDGSDLAHPLYAAALDLGHYFTSVPFTTAEPALAVNGGNTTAVALDSIYRLPSSEITLVDQAQWSEDFPVNPYSAYTPPPPLITLTPSQFTWSVRKGSGFASYQELMNLAVLLLAQQQRIVEQAGSFPPGVVTSTEEAIQAAIAAVGRELGRHGLQPIVIRIDGRDYFPDEDNIVGSFASAAINLTPVSPTVAGSVANTVKADAGGRFAARFTVPTAAIGNYTVRAQGPVSDASSTFAGLVKVLPPPPPPPPPRRDPVAESFYPTRPETLSAFSCWFTAKDASIPITCQIRTMVGGFPGDVILATKTLIPSEISLNAEAKFAFDQYVVTDQPVAFCLMTRSNAYKIQTATLGKAGRNPSTWIVSNPYEAGVLFSSSNAESWSVHQTSDMRFKVYGRLFTSPAVLEFANIPTVNFSDLWLGADVQIPTGGTITWEFEQNGDGVIHPLEPFERRRLAALATSVILRARLSTTDLHVSPVLPVVGIGLLGFLNTTTGKYISRMAEFTQDLVSGKVYAQAAIPGGTSVTWFASNDDGANWDAVSAESGYPVAIDSEWSEYGFTLSFGGSSGRRKLRLRADFAGTALLTPRIARVGATVS